MHSSEAIADFVNGEPPKRVLALVEALKSGTVTLHSSRARLSYALPPGPRIVERAANLLATWRADVEADEVALATSLAAAAAVRAHTEARGPRCELAWTGPVEPHGVRYTHQVVREMLSLCTRQALVVQYAITGHGTPQGVIGELGRLRSEGVQVTFVVDARWNNGASLRAIKGAWPQKSPAPDIFSYEVEDDEMAKLHAKVLLVDGRDLFVSSANLTGYGLGVNLEFGVRVQGEPAVLAQTHFDALIDSGRVDRVMP